MKFIDTELPDVRVLVPKRHADTRGFLSETWNQRTLDDAGIRLRFVQDNHSASAAAGTIRGLHFQLPPLAQHKLVRVVRGAILDVAVDLRRSSSTFGRHVAVELSADAWNQLLIPVGFAHGFCTLTPDTHVIYKVTSHYSPDRERGVLFSDPALGIKWPVPPDQALMSDRDRALPKLAELADVFE